MPDFSDQPVGATCLPCQRGKKGAAAPKGWTVDCVLKIFCKNDKKIVEQLAKTEVITADEIYFDDPFFDGTKWTVKRFQAGGSADPEQKEITILAGTSCEGAADTFFHEIWHQNQPKGMGWPEPAEDDAYFKTEEWLISRGLPGNDAIRTTDPATGKVAPDKAAIRKMVQDEYPGPPPAVAGKKQPVPVSFDATKNETKVRDPDTGRTSWRPSQAGDTVPGPQHMDNRKVIDKSKWKCP